jgi:transcriptional regulator with XRE-family HTH domain
MEYGKQIASRRRAAGLTRRALAEVSGVSYSTIRRIETDPQHTPSRRTRDLLEIALQSRPRKRAQNQDDHREALSTINDVLPKNYSRSLFTDMLPKNYVSSLFTDILPKNYVRSVIPKNFLADIAPGLYVDHIIPKNFFKSVYPELDFSPFRNLIQISTPTNRILGEHLAALRPLTASTALDQAVAALRATALKPAEAAAQLSDQAPGALAAGSMHPPTPDATAASAVDPETARTVAEQLGVDAAGTELGEDFYTHLADAAGDAAEEIDPAVLLQQIREQDPALAKNIEQAAAVLEVQAQLQEGLAIKATVGIFLALYWVLRLFVNSIPVAAATEDTAKAAKEIGDKVEDWFDK